ncbi:MAG: putative metal-binding motif-containing protein, partial [bacterium]
MKKKIFRLSMSMLSMLTSFFLLLGLNSSAVAASLPNGTLLTIDNGFEGASSYFTMAVTSTTILTTQIRSTTATGTQHAKSTMGGILLGTPQAAGSGSHIGTTTSADSNSIDAPWNFFFNTGEHFQSAAGITDNGDGTLNMAGWNVSWNGIPAINMGSGPAGVFNKSADGTHYSLDYYATVPLGDPSSFGGVPYGLHIQGRIVLPACTDSDGDGYGTSDNPSCAQTGIDCDDGNIAINPGATEVCDGVDNNCAGGIDEGVTNACGTCEPVPVEICDNVDNDGDGQTDENLIQDTTCGVGQCAGNTGTKTCTAGVWGPDTCDPLAGATPEVCYNGDEDCDGQTDEGGVCAGQACPDQDNDTFANCVEGCVLSPGDNCDGDCNDGNIAINPGATEVCDGVDNNCAGGIDEGVTNACGTCEPVPPEVCDGVDNDCDGQIDEGLKNACGACGPVPQEVCDGVDNDCDGQIDEGLKN